VCRGVETEYVFPLGGWPGGSSLFLSSPWQYAKWENTVTILHRTVKRGCSALGFGGWGFFWCPVPKGLKRYYEQGQEVAVSCDSLRGAGGKSQREGKLAKSSLILSQRKGLIG